MDKLKIRKMQARERLMATLADKDLMAEIREEYEQKKQEKSQKVHSIRDLQFRRLVRGTMPRPQQSDESCNVVPLFGYFNK